MVWLEAIDDVETDDKAAELLLAMCCDNIGRATGQHGENKHKDDIVDDISIIKICISKIDAANIAGVLLVYSRNDHSRPQSALREGEFGGQTVHHHLALRRFVRGWTLPDS